MHGSRYYAYSRLIPGQLTADKDLLVASIPLATAFTKNLGSTFLPAASLTEESQPTPAETAALESAEAGKLVSMATKDKFRKLLGAYYEALSRRAVRDHTVSRAKVCVFVSLKIYRHRPCSRRTGGTTMHISAVGRSSKIEPRTTNVSHDLGRSCGPGYRGKVDLRVY